MEEEIVEKKSLFQICITEKATDKILYSNILSAWNETEAIQKTKIGSVIQDKGLTRNDVDFYIRGVGMLYEGTAFAEILAETPALTPNEVERLNIKEAFSLSDLYGLTQAQLETYIDNNVTNLAEAKAFLKKLSAVVLWLVKQNKLDE